MTVETNRLYTFAGV